MANTIKVKLCKIENWFKHKRRMDVSLGLMKFEKKKVFSLSEKILLQKEFELNKNPSEEKYQELYVLLVSSLINFLIFRADNFNCEKKNIKNWFSYRRKLLLKLKRKIVSKKEQKTKEIQVKVEDNGHQNQDLQWLWFLNWMARLNESFSIFRMNQVLLNFASYSH